MCHNVESLCVGHVRVAFFMSCKSKELQATHPHIYSARAGGSCRSLKRSRIQGWLQTRVRCRWSWWLYPSLPQCWGFVASGSRHKVDLLERKVEISKVHVWTFDETCRLWGDPIPYNLRQEFTRHQRLFSRWYSAAECRLEGCTIACSRAAWNSSGVGVMDSEMKA